MEAAVRYHGRVVPESPLPKCPRCGALFEDYPEGRQAHVVVFGHEPRELTKWERLTKRGRSA